MANPSSSFKELAIDDRAMKFLGLRHQDVTIIMAEVMESVAGISEQMETD
jgi:hypothetical protein